MSTKLVDGHGVFAESVDACKRQLLDRRVCIDEDEAKDIAEAVMLDTWRQYAGSTIYVRKTIENIVPARDARLFADHEAGVPIQELVRRYKLSDSYVYRIIARISAARRRNLQQDLFE